jgi:hypothetical protein
MIQRIDACILRAALCALVASASVPAMAQVTAVFPTTAPSNTQIASVSLLSLQNVRVLSPGAAALASPPAVTAYPLNSPPIGGFTPQVVITLTDEWDLNEYYALPSSTPGGSRLPIGAPKYLVATYDTGSQTHLLHYTDIQAMDLPGANREGGGSMQISGATGTEYADITDGLGIYATGFSQATSSGGVISVGTTTMAGQYNTSILSTQSTSSIPTNVIGTPMTAMYQTGIYNTQPKHLVVGGNTLRSPEVTFGPKTADPPPGYSKLQITKVPANSFLITTPPSLTISSLDFPDDPIFPTLWYSMMASVGANHTAGSFSGSQFLFDTGAEVTVMSEFKAAEVGYTTGGDNPSTPDFYVDVAGFGGATVHAPGFYLNSMSISTNGGPITWTHVPIVVLNLPDPAGVNDYVDGILGMNLFSDRNLIINADVAPNPSYIGISPQWQWNINGGGSWTNSSNWSLALPNGMDMQANFYGKITSPQTITVDSDVTAGTISFDNANRYTLVGPGRINLQVSGGEAQINVSTGSHTIAAPMTLHNDTSVTVWQGTSRLTLSNDVTATGKAISKYGSGALEMTNIRAGTLNVNGGTVMVTANGTSTGTSRVGALSIDSTPAANTHLDLGNNSMIVDYTGSSPLATIRTYLQAGYAGGAWNGAGGINSSAANAGTFALGSADNHALNLGSFAGLPITADDVLIKFTYYGDANLDGKVNAADLGALAMHWQQAGTVWTGGDFNYDGMVDITDLYLLAHNWKQGVTSPLGTPLDNLLASFGLPDVSVPEPAMALTILSMLLIHRRRSNGACAAS